MFFFEFLLSYMILVLKICSERVHVKYLNCMQRCSVSPQCSFYFTRVWNQSKIWIRIRIQAKTLNSYFTTAEWATLRRLLLYFVAVLIFLRNQIAIFMQLQKQIRIQIRHWRGVIGCVIGGDERGDHRPHGGLQEVHLQHTATPQRQVKSSSCCKYLDKFWT